MDSDYLIRWMTNECTGESSMARALQNVIQHAITTPGCGLGLKHDRDPRNLSYILASYASPVLISLRENPDKLGGMRPFFRDSADYDKHCEYLGWQISSILKDLRPDSKTNDLLHAFDTINDVVRDVAPNVQRELKLLADALHLIKGEFSRKYKSHKSSDDPTFCRYCYRNSHDNSDVCHKHQGNQRPTDKRHGLVPTERYRALRKNRKLYNAIRDEVRLNGIAGLPLTRAVLENQRISLVPTVENRLEWIEHILGTLDIAEEWPIGNFVKRIPAKFCQPDMPIVLPIHGNLVRHEIWMLAQASASKLRSASILKREKKGERVSISSLAEEIGISRQALHKQVKALKESNDPILLIPDRLLELALKVTPDVK